MCISLEKYEPPASHGLYHTWSDSGISVVGVSSMKSSFCEDSLQGDWVVADDEVSGGGAGDVGGKEAGEVGGVVEDGGSSPISAKPELKSASRERHVANFAEPPSSFESGGTGEPPLRFRTHSLPTLVALGCERSRWDLSVVLVDAQPPAANGLLWLLPEVPAVDSWSFTGGLPNTKTPMKLHVNRRLHSLNLPTVLSEAKVFLSLFLKPS